MRRNRVTLNCKECSASYEVKFCLRDTSKFCSNPCRSKYNAQGNRNANYRGGSTQAQCMDCQKTIYRNYKKEQSRCRPCSQKFLTGKNSPNWKGGVTLPSCVNCSAQTGDMRSVLCRNCYRGALHPAWNGGASPLQSLVRQMPENRQWIKQCMYRDRFTCQECETLSNGSNLQVHHKKQFAQILKDNKIDSIEAARSCGELWDMDNGVTLCRSCHKLTESFNRKLA